MVDVIMDSKFIAIYVLKIVHYLVLLGALFLTEKLFSEMYMKRVYAENSDPPDILVMLGIFLAIDAGFMLFLITILLLLMYIFKTDSDSSIFNGNLIKSFLGDFALFISVVAIISAIIGHVIQQKRYFRYKTEGLRGIRAYKDIIAAIAGIITLVPFFAFFGGGKS